MQSLADNLHALSARIATACRAVGRDPATVKVIGVAKTKPIAAVLEAANLGVTDIGENYLDEALDKVAACAELDLTWHYIGRIQSNKTKLIARSFDWVHTVDRLKIAQRLNNQCPAEKRLNILIQVNIDADPAKGGVSPADAKVLLDQLLDLEHLQIRGLMTILSQRTDPRASYESMAQLFADLRAGLPDQHSCHWDTLSMGMTADLEQAIGAGATHIRIGTALFGAREN